MAHVGFMIYDSCECKFKGFSTITFNEKKIQKNTCKGCNTIGVRAIGALIAKVNMDEIFCCRRVQTPTNIVTCHIGGKLWCQSKDLAI